MGSMNQKIVPNLWFDREAEEAARLYTSLFDSARITATSRYTDVGQEVHGMEAGTAMVVELELDGFRISALNGGPSFTLNPSISFFVNCDSVREVDGLWEKLSDGGTVLMPLDAYSFSERYGWVQDRFGVSWQLILSEGETAQRIIPSLLFVGEQCGNAEDAINFYASLFSASKVGEIFRYGPEQKPDTEGTVAYADFTLAGQRFAAMDSAQDHKFGFSEAISFVVDCDDQAEVDYYWERLSAVPQAEQCGWIKDKYGVSWQVIPSALPSLVGGPDPEGSRRAMAAMLQMRKLDIAELQRAYDGD